MIYHFIRVWPCDVRVMQDVIEVGGSGRTWRALTDQLRRITKRSRIVNAVVIDMPLLLKQGSFCPSFSVVAKYKTSFFFRHAVPEYGTSAQWWPT